MVPFVVSRLLLIMVAHFLLLGTEVLALDALIFCLLSSWFSSGFVWCFFCRGGGRGYMCVCIFFFLRISSICSYLVQIYELILFFCGFCDVTKDNIPGELNVFNTFPLFVRTLHFLSCVCLY